MEPDGSLPRFITAFTSARPLPLSCASSIQSIPTHPTSWKSFLLFSLFLRLGLPIYPFPSDFPNQISEYTAPIPHMCYLPRPSHYSRFNHPKDLGEQYN